MDAVVAVIVGMAFGSILAAAVALPLRRRRTASRSDRPARTRRIPLDRPEQRVRAAWVAAGFAVSATIAQVAGWAAPAAYLMLGAVFLAAQTAMSALLVRVRGR